MRDLKEILEEKLRLLDPTLSTGKASDLYSDVIKQANIDPGAAFESFAKEMTIALEKVYGTGWLLNQEVSRDVVMHVLYSSVKASVKPEVIRDSVWYDGSICRFVFCGSTQIPIGKTFYFRDNKSSDQGFNFETNFQKPKTILINFSDELSVGIDQMGRLLYPAHYFDNLFLEEESSTALELPQNITKGRVYIVEPSMEILEECRYLKISTLSSFTVDKEKKIIQFGKQVGEVNIEVVSGFVLSFSQDRLINAWLKIENTSV